VFREPAVVKAGGLADSCCATDRAVRPRTADGCTTGMMRKANGGRVTSDAALLLAWGIALLVRHASNGQLDARAAPSQVRPCTAAIYAAITFAREESSSGSTPAKGAGVSTPGFVAVSPVVRAELGGRRSQRVLGSLDVWRRRRWFEVSGSLTWLTRFCSRGSRTPSSGGWPSEGRGAGSSRGGAL
jgi:hypothetical protein